MESVTSVLPEQAGVYRFVPRKRAAAAENRLASVVGALIAFAFFHFARDVAFAANVGLSLLTAALIYVFYTLRARVVGLHAVEITGEGLTVEGRRGRRSLLWDEVRSARHTYLGGDRWTLLARSGAALELILDGYTPEEASRINALIRARVDARRGCD